MGVSTEELEGIHLFSLLDATERSVLAARLTEEATTAGQALFSFGDPGDCMYIVKTGCVELWVKTLTGERVVLERVREGEFFGEISMLDQGPRTASATVIEAGEVIAVDRGDLDHLIKMQPGAAMDLLTASGQRLRESTNLLRNTASRNVNEEFEEDSNWLMRSADAVAAFSGSISFLLLHLCFFSAWIVLNTGLLGNAPFDAYPFGLLTMAVSLEAIMLTTLLLFSSNRQSARDRTRSDIEYDVNLKAELQIQQLHEKFDTMNAEMLRRLAAIESSSRAA
ncbi:MAG: DUF1003 domain-containing protein [Myxococcales bacterium]|nr:DUF1003 domain-containing protein [Myxococcales bacterium]